MALTKVSGGILQQPIDVGIITATSIQVGSGTTIHDAGIDLGSGNITSHNINSTGIVTSTGLDVNGDGDISGDLSVSGNVSIGGTLTYEDVTNIDSVGLITARSGIQVTGGSVGIGSDNPTDVVDILTGGSDEVTSLKVKTQGRVELSRNHSDAPYIKTLMNSGNPNIILGDSGGDKVLINGDGSSYFNGGNIGIGTDNPSAKLHLSNTGSTQMMISNMSSGMNDGDTIGVLDFAAGPNHTVNARIAGHIEGTDELGGDLVFETREDGGSLLEKLRITSGGDVGIGLTNPQGKLEIAGNASSTTQFSGFNGLRIHNTNGAAFGVSADMYFTAGTLTSNRGAAIGVQYESGAGGNDLYFATNPGAVTNSDTLHERLRITSNGNVGINTNDPTSKITINVDSNNQTMASYDGINISNSDTTVNNGSAVIFGFGPSSPNSFSRIGVQNKDRGSGTESQDLFFGTISNGSYAERLRIGTNGRLCLHNVTDGANSSYGKFEIQHVGNSGVDPNTSYLSFHRTANTAFQMGIVDNKFVLGVTGGGARDDVQTPHVVFDPTGTDTILGLGTTIPNGKGLDITHSRTNSYSQTTDQRNLAHLILRNGSDAPDRFTSLSMVNGGGTQAEGSINLVQNGNYRGHFTFKLRHSGGSTDWMERFRIGTDGELIQYSYGQYIRYYTTTTNGSLYRTHVAISMNGNVAYEFRFAGAGNGVVWIRTMASHWTSTYGLVRESYCFMDSYAGLSEANQYSLTSSAQGSWSFTRPISGQTGYQSHLVINKSAGSYGGGMTGLIILESDRPFELVSIT